MSAQRNHEQRLPLEKAIALVAERVVGAGADREPNRQAVVEKIRSEITRCMKEQGLSGVELADRSSFVSQHPLLPRCEIRVPASATGSRPMVVNVAAVRGKVRFAKAPSDQKWAIPADTDLARRAALISEFIEANLTTEEVVVSASMYNPPERPSKKGKKRIQTGDEPPESIHDEDQINTTLPEGAIRHPYDSDAIFVKPEKQRSPKRLDQLFG